MGRYAYVNGRYVDHLAAQVHIEDRGYQFADGVYEVVGVRDGRLIVGDRTIDTHGEFLRTDIAFSGTTSGSPSVSSESGPWAPGKTIFSAMRKRTIPRMKRTTVIASPRSTAR